MAPAPAKLEPPGDLPVERVTIASDSGSTLAGWFLAGRPGRGAVLLLHPIRANRSAMLGRARLLAAQGCSVLLVDLQAHGESPGRQITFGWLESRDARAAIAYLHERLPGERAGAIGISLGGASILMGALPGSLDAAVVEATYATLGDALDDRLRMRLGPLAPLAAPLLSIQLRLRLGISAQELRPVDAIAGIGCPVLVVAGDRDRHAPPSESRRLFAAASEPRELWVVSGAGHEDFLAKDERGYRARVLPFLQKHLAVERTSSRALLRGGPGCLIPLRSRA